MTIGIADPYRTYCSNNVMLGNDDYTVCHMTRSWVIRSSNRNLHYPNCGHGICTPTYLVFHSIHVAIGTLLRLASSHQLQFQVESLVHEASMQISVKYIQTVQHTLSATVMATDRLGRLLNVIQFCNHLITSINNIMQCIIIKLLNLTLTV